MKVKPPKISKRTGKPIRKYVRRKKAAPTAGPYSGYLTTGQAETDKVSFSDLDTPKMAEATMARDTDVPPGIRPNAEACVDALLAEKKCIEDPWIHRSEGMRCRTCMWWVQKQFYHADPVLGPIGRCRHNSPTMDGFPVVYATDWCGQHRVDDDKE